MSSLACSLGNGISVERERRREERGGNGREGEGRAGKGREEEEGEMEEGKTKRREGRVGGKREKGGAV